LIRYVVGCLVVALVLFLLFIGIIFALTYFFAGDVLNWVQDTFQYIPGWLQDLLQTLQQN
jgi:predicted PurR-regulated permease PerM